MHLAPVPAMSNSKCATDDAMLLLQVYTFCIYQHLVNLGKYELDLSVYKCAPYPAFCRPQKSGIVHVPVSNISSQAGENFVAALPAARRSSGFSQQWQLWPWTVQHARSCCLILAWSPLLARPGALALLDFTPDRSRCNKEQVQLTTPPARLLQVRPGALPGRGAAYACRLS